MRHAYFACVAVSQATMYSVSGQNSHVSDVELVSTTCDYMGYLTLFGKCRDWGRSPLRRICWGGLHAQESSDLPHPLPWQPPSGYLALHNLYVYLPESLYTLPPPLPPLNIHRNTLRVYHAQRTYKNTWENGLLTFPSRFSL